MLLKFGIGSISYRDPQFLYWNIFETEGQIRKIITIDPDKKFLTRYV